MQDNWCLLSIFNGIDKLFYYGDHTIWTTSQSCKVVQIKINVNLYTPRLKFNYRSHSTAVVLFNKRLNTMREKMRENVVKSIN